MAEDATPDVVYRCAGPNCGQVKAGANRWWLMWTDVGPKRVPVLHLCEWDAEIARQQAALHVCGEGCAQKLQSVFMANIRENRSLSKQD